MICYRDMTFCHSDHHEPHCKRRLTDLVLAEADVWWIEGGGNPGEAPIASADFCGDYRRNQTGHPETDEILANPDTLEAIADGEADLSDSWQVFPDDQVSYD